MKQRLYHLHTFQHRLLSALIETGYHAYLQTINE
ncbi:MAG: hypothetical protein ACI8RD_001230 [Bacillariaceae sp.]|jgi:hypothetical protein